MAPAKSVIPRNGEFNEGRLWFQRKGSLVTVGVTSLAVEDLGDIQSVELPDEGEDFAKGDALLTIEGTNGSIEVLAPAAGVVHEVNSGLEEEPERITEDPLEEGWLVQIDMEDPSDLREFSPDSAEDLEDEDDSSEDEDEEEDEEEDDESEE